MVNEQELLNKILEYIDELLSMLALVLTNECILKIENIQNKIKKISNKNLVETKNDIKKNIQN